jgi:GT2 family glycosyltransferase
MSCLSIALVNWNTRELLDQCLSSIYRSTHDIDYEVIVVDNASEDGSTDMLAERHPGVMVIPSKINMGFAAGCNLAFKHSNGRYFLLLNTDTIVRDGALDSMVAFMDRRPDAGAVGCKLLNPDGSLQRSCSIFPSPATELFDALYLSKLFPRSRLFGAYAMSHWGFDEVREVDFAGGGCLMGRRSAIEEVGLLDEGYFMYTEEADFCCRLWQRGWKVYYTPDAEVVHLGGQSSKKFGSDILLNLYYSRHRFVRKFRGASAARAMGFVIALGAAARLSAYCLQRLRNPEDTDLRNRMLFQKKLLRWAGRQVISDRLEYPIGAP